MIITTLCSSYSKRFEKEDYTISFKENNRFITTKKGLSTLNYIGETSTSIFLYDIESKKTKIYSKSNVSDYEIQNTGSIDDYIIKIKESYPVELLIDLLNEK